MYVPAGRKPASTSLVSWPTGRLVEKTCEPSAFSMVRRPSINSNGNTNINVPVLGLGDTVNRRGWGLVPAIPKGQQAMASETFTMKAAWLLPQVLETV